MKAVKKIKINKKLKGYGSVLNPISKKYDAIVSKMNVGSADYERCKSCKELSNNFLVYILKSGDIYYYCDNCKNYVFLTSKEVG